MDYESTSEIKYICNKIKSELYSILNNKIDANLNTNYFVIFVLIKNNLMGTIFVI